MKRRTDLMGWLFLFAILTLSSAGCAVFGERSCEIIYNASLTDGTTVRVNREVNRNLVLGKDYNYARLVLYLDESSTDALHAEVARVTKGEQDPQRDDFWSGFDDVQLEGWTDDTGTRVWIRDRRQDVIVATVDRKTRAVTGLGEPIPSWADANGGRLLEPHAASP